MTSIVTLAAYDPNDVKPGWIAFWIVMALVVATFFLWRNMNAQLRKIKAPYKDEVRDTADSPADRAADEPDDSANPS